MLFVPATDRKRMFTSYKQLVSLPSREERDKIHTSYIECGVRYESPTGHPSIWEAFSFSNFDIEDAIDHEIKFPSRPAKWKEREKEFKVSFHEHLAFSLFLSLLNACSTTISLQCKFHREMDERTDGRGRVMCCSTSSYTYMHTRLAVSFPPISPLQRPAVRKQVQGPENKSQG